MGVGRCLDEFATKGELRWIRWTSFDRVISGRHPPRTMCECVLSAANTFPTRDLVVPVGQTGLSGLTDGESDTVRGMQGIKFANTFTVAKPVRHQGGSCWT